MYIDKAPFKQDQLVTWKASAVFRGGFYGTLQAWSDLLHIHSEICVTER